MISGTVPERLSALIRAVVVDVLWRTIKRLPLSILLWAAVFLAVGATVSIVWVPRAELGSLGTPFAQTLVTLGFVAAGMLWGLLRALHVGARRAMSLAEDEANVALAAMLDPIVDRSGIEQVPVAEFRRQWMRFLEGGEAPPAGRRRGLRAWLGRRLGQAVELVLRSRSRGVFELVDSIERQGQTHVPLAELKTALCSQLVGSIRDVLQARLLMVEAVVAAVVALLVVVPLAAVWLAARALP